MPCPSESSRPNKQKTGAILILYEKACQRGCKDKEAEKVQDRVLLELWRVSTTSARVMVGTGEDHT